VPLIGLPVVVAAVLASEGRFGGGTPVASGTPQTVVQPTTTQAAASQPATPQPVATAAPTQVEAQPTPAQAGATQVRAQPAAPTNIAVATQAATGSAAARTSAATTSAVETAPARAVGEVPFLAYRVRPGDTIKFIAQTYGVSIASIAQASGLRNPDQLRVGQLLTIPDRPGWLYRVRPGETLDQIAARTGVPTAIIASVSKLPSDAVQAGDVILIPEQTTFSTK
jgi:LysM repeat protein